jgi:hypothetical protein
MALVCLAGMLVAAPGRAAASGSASSGSDETLVGTWAVQVTLRDCATNAPLGPPFNSLVTFHRGGTLSETAGSTAFAPGQRSPGHGTWARRHGHRYRQEMISLLLFDTAPNLPGAPGFDPTKPVSPGFSAGWVTVSHTVRLADADHIASSGSNTFYNTSGVAYRTGCSTATGERFE